MSAKVKSAIHHKILLALPILIFVLIAPNYSCTGLFDSDELHAPSDFTAIEGNMQITLSWQKGSDSDKVLLKYDTSSYPTSVTDGTLAYEGTGTSTVHIDVEYGNIYFYTIWSARLIDGDCVYSTDYSNAYGTPNWFAPSGFTATAGNQLNTLSWHMVSGDDQVLVMCDTSSYPTSATDGILVYKGNKTSYIHTGLDYGETYYYTVWSARFVDQEWIYSSDKETTSAIPYWQGPDGEELHEYVERDFARAVGADGEYIELFNNPEAHDPTWHELRQFLSVDETDKQLYDLSSFVCADFAEMLHNNAEDAGIRTAYVSIEFYSLDVGHAINAFDTSDLGMVYIDSTGTMAGDLNADKTVDLVIGNEYVPVSIFPNPGYESEWEGMGQVSDFWVQW